MTPPSPCSFAQRMSSTAFSTSENETRAWPARRPGVCAAEVRQPSVVGQPRLAVELGVGERADVVGRPRLEGQPVGEQDLGHHTLALDVLQAEIRVPLRGRLQARAEISALGRSGRLLGPHPLVEDVEILLLDVVPIVAP